MLDIKTIVDRIADGLVAVDAMKLRSKPQYLPGLQSMTEIDVCAEIRDWWNGTFPSDFNPVDAIGIERLYPKSKIATKGRRPQCDIVLSTDGVWPDPEWGIEVKRIQLVGNNGKNNDFGLAKVISPYLKDRSLAHDAIRLRASGLSRRSAVVAYGFEYDAHLLRVAAQIHLSGLAQSAVMNLRSVCIRNDPANLEYGLLPLIEVVDLILNKQCPPKSFFETTREGLWAHPCGGRVRVFGWEI